MKKNQFKKERLIWIFIIITILLIQFTPFFSFQGEKTKENEKKYLNLLNEALFYVKTSYIDASKISYKKLIYGAISGMLNSLNDSHSIFLNEEEYKNLITLVKQKFGGIGIYINFSKTFPMVVSLIKNTPASRSGIKPGDYIIEIEGKSSKEMKDTEITNRLKGSPGTIVNIKISRENVTKPISVRLKREIIQIESVESGLIKNEIAYVKITNFGENTTHDLKKQLNHLKLKGMTKLILDLRNNPGGLLSTAIEVTNMFINKGKILSTKGRYKNDNKIYYANKSKTVIPESIPIIVLVNEKSASASEIIAGALKDTKRGLIVGEKTFGKGSVQNIIKLNESNENIAIRLTIQEYFTPSMKSIHGKGIEPDIKIIKRTKNIENFYKKQKLYTSKYFKSFLKKIKFKYKKIDLDKLILQLKTEGINLDKKIIETYIQKELKNNNKRKKLFNLKNDIQLKKAVDLIEKKNKELYKIVKVF